MKIGFYTSDPGEQAYYDIKAKTFDFLDDKGIERPSVTPTKKSNALYYYKQALKFGDLKAAHKYLGIYMELGGTDTGIEQSVKRSAPLGSLAKKDHREFLATLTPEEYDRYELALAWYNDTYVNRPRTFGQAARDAKEAAGNTIREILQRSKQGG